jgi:tRNA(Ile)-lysidine synthase
VTSGKKRSREGAAAVVLLEQRVAGDLKRQQMLRPGERISVAVSGGADSVALLLLLVELRQKLGVVLSVAHFNHQLRGAAADADEKFVVKLATKHGLPIHVGRADVASKARREKANLEDAARRARYEYFGRLVEEGIVTRVAVAQTADDQAETVLAHILRGTGLAGLGGIHPVAKHIVRPLIALRRAELRAYLRAKKQTWREDATNRDTTKMRARIRKKLLPLLEKQFQPAIVKHLNSLAELAREDEAFLDALAAVRCGALVREEKHAKRIAVANLLRPLGLGDFDTEVTEHEEKKDREHREHKLDALTKRMLRLVIEESKVKAGQITGQHIAAVLELAQHGKNGKSLQLPGGVEVRREREELVFCTAGTGAKSRSLNQRERAFEHHVELHGCEAEVRVPELGCVFRLRVIDWPPKRGETKETGAVLDRDRLQFPLVLRSWLPGDRLQPVGRRNAHKLKRLLNEKRISRWERDGWPVLTSGEVLVWARGFPVAAQFAANERTRAGMVIEEEPIESGAVKALPAGAAEKRPNASVASERRA